MEHFSDQHPERPEPTDQQADGAAPYDSESAAYWQELDGYQELRPDPGTRADDALAERPVGGISKADQVAQNVAFAVVMPAFARVGGQDEMHGSTGRTAAADEAASDRVTADRSGDGPTIPPTDRREVAGDDGGLPKRERGDERTLPDAERERLVEVSRARILHSERSGDTHVLSLPDGSQSSFQVTDAGEQRTASNWRIDIHDGQQDFGIGRRLAKETADELIRQEVDQLDFSVDSEASLRTAITVFGDSIKYIDPQGAVEVTSPRQALELLNSRAQEDGVVDEGIQAEVDLGAFSLNQLAYHTAEDETVFDRCDFANIQADENGMYGEVHAFRARLLDLPEPHATNATLAFNELLANYESHVSPVNPGERYEIRVSWVQDPDSEDHHVRLTNYFFGDVHEGVVEGINLRLSQLGTTEAFFGQSRESQGAEVDEADVEAEEVLEQMGEETTAHLQQSGRGLAAIARVSTRAMTVRFPDGGGGFVIDLKNVEVAREPSGGEVAGGRAAEEDVDDLIDKFLTDFPDLPDA